MDKPMDIEEIREQAQRFLSVLPHPQASLVKLLGMIVQSQGCVSDEMQSTLAQTCDVPLDQVRELVLEYQSSPTEPANSLRVCGDLVCSLHGTPEVIDSLRKFVPNDTPVVIVGCPGYCYAAPVVQTPDGTFCRATLTDSSGQQIHEPELGYSSGESRTG